MGWLTEFRDLKSTTVTGRRAPVSTCKPAQGKRDPVTGSREVTSFLVTEFRHLEVPKVELRAWVSRGQYGPPKGETPFPAPMWITACPGGGGGVV